MPRRSVAPLVAAALTAVLGAAARLEACSCTNQHTLQEEVAAANTVFFGHVTAIQLAGDIARRTTRPQDRIGPLPHSYKILG